MSSLLGTAGCAASSAPQGWLPQARQAPTDAWGGWADVYSKGRGHRLARGELIAVAADSVYIAETGWDRLELGAVVSGDSLTYRLLTLPRTDVGSLVVRGYSGLQGATAVSGALALSAFSHGWWAILTFPTWLGIHAGMTRAEEGMQTKTYRAPHSGRGSLFAEAPSPHADDAWLGLRQWARYPQGLPDGLPRASVRPYVHRYPSGPALPKSQPIPRGGATADP